MEVLGIDISKIAIKNAKRKYPSCKFIVGDIMDKHLYKEFKPDIIVMSEITWYILNKIDDFIMFFKKELKDTWLIHLLTI